MIAADRVKELVESKIAGTDLFLISVDVRPGNKILVTLDSDTSLTIDHCVDVSRHVENQLDRESEDFALEVSSPGLSEPLKVTRQYVKNIGRDVSVKMTDGKKEEGKLTSADETGFTISKRVREAVEGTKKKAWVERDIRLAYSDIKETKIVIRFK
ncbi:MAG: ribosome assembly cofactor RimP [Bacteroidota bacterium]